MQKRILHNPALENGYLAMAADAEYEAAAGEWVNGLIGGMAYQKLLDELGEASFATRINRRFVGLDVEGLVIPARQIARKPYVFGDWRLAGG